MKKIVLLILFLYINTYANYSTPGTGRSWNLDSLVANSSGNVTYSGGVYFVNDTVNVLASDTLKILSNATIKLAYLVTFNFIGTLIINPPDSVKITSVDTIQKFYEMRLDSLSGASVLRKTIFEYSTNGLRLLSTSPLIDSCIVRFNCIGNSSVTVQAINLFKSNAVISHCKIFRNAKVAIGGSANINNAPRILNNVIFENNTANGNVPQINLGASGSATTIIRGNSILGLYNNAGGIATLPIGTLSIVIENNIIKNNRYGIAITNATTNAIIRGNVIDSNNIQGNPMLGGSGINFNGNSSVIAAVSKNIIRGNLWGITIQGTALPNFGDLTNPDTNFIGLNQIYNNHNSGGIFDLYNNTPDSIKAENNYWGTTNLDSIEAHIFHHPDSSALGWVDYLPIYVPTGIGNIQNQLPDAFKLYDAYPNPFNPVTTIKFSVPDGNVYMRSIQLNIYDAIGKKVANLINGELKPGNYEINWDASNFASGVYFYSLNVNDLSGETALYNITKKLILLK